MYVTYFLYTSARPHRAHHLVHRSGATERTYELVNDMTRAESVWIVPGTISAED